ncbi:MAG TPA: hypothetical protein VFV41_02815 [Streptosporangiaceae bacterium]|nr:hypothetical protein [Streptosporangiaceae bacterium]
MVTLRIEHPIRDYELWQSAFDRFARARQQAGVRGYVIRRPAGDPDYLMIDLEFGSAEQAAGFAEFLQTRVWSSPGSSPALAGVPVTRILDVVRTGKS